MKNITYNTGKTSWTHGENLPADWHKYKGPCPTCGAPTFDYGGGWRCLAIYCHNNANNPAPNVGPEPKWWNTGIQVMKDGNQWVAMHSNFINLQESNAGFGDTPNDAVNELLSIEPIP